MSSRGSKLLRSTTNHVLDALLTAAERAFHGGPVTMHGLHDIVAGLKMSPQFDDFYLRAYGDLAAMVEHEKIEHKRVNAFGRLVVHQLGELLEDGTLDRDLLPNIFSFLHLVLGDDAQTYGDRCTGILGDMKSDLGEDFTWDAFYDEPAAKLVLWNTLTRIAASFKRWDLRKDWFIKLMQYTPTTVSLGQSAFVVREVDHTDEPRVFGNREFCAFFTALFAPLTHIDPEDEAAFRKAFGTDPHHLIGQFLVHLASCRI
jgi:hypothetical protein